MPANNPPDASAASPTGSVFDLGDFVLQCGEFIDQQLKKLLRE